MTGDLSQRATARMRTIPFAFQAGFAFYILLTGDLLAGLQGALFGLPPGASGAFSVFILSALALDALRLAPLLMLARNPVGILHPLILMVLVWPVINALPYLDQQFGPLVGLLSGQPAQPPYFTSLPGYPSASLWWGMATHNGLQIIGLVTVYVVFTLGRRPRGGPISHRVAPPIDRARLRSLMLVIAGAAVLGTIGFVASRGGFDSHLQALAGGRFGALAGMGPLIVLLDIGVIAAIVWLVSVPRDVSNPIFVAVTLALSTSQFLLNGSRGEALLVIVTLGLAWCLRTGRIPWRAALFAAPILLAAYGALTVARSAAWSGTAASVALQRLDARTALATAQADTLARATERGGVPVVIAGFDRSGGPLWGQTYVAAVLAIVPRAIWKDKPRGPGSTFSILFLGGEIEGATIPIGMVGEAYWNFGVFGVVLVYALFGWAMRFALGLYLRNPIDPFVTTFYVLFVARFQVATEALVAFQQSLLLLLLIWILHRIISQRRASAPPALFKNQALWDSPARYPSLMRGRRGRGWHFR